MLRVPLQVRLGEKETLDVVQRYFEDRSRKLKQLEYYQVGLWCPVHHVCGCLGKAFTDSDNCEFPQNLQERRLKGLGLLDDNDQNTW